MLPLFYYMSNLTMLLSHISCLGGFCGRGGQLDQLLQHSVERRPSQSHLVADSRLGIRHCRVPHFVLGRLSTQSQGTGGLLRLECLLSAGDTDHGGSRCRNLSHLFAGNVAGLGIFGPTDFWNPIHGSVDELAFCAVSGTLLMDWMPKELYNKILVWNLL